MARAPEKKPGVSGPVVTRVLPMQLKLGDRLTDETGEYDVIGQAWEV